MRLCLSVFLLATQIEAFPRSESSSIVENTASKDVGHLSFSLANPKDDPHPDSSPSFIQVIEAVAKSTLFEKLMQFLGGVTTGKGSANESPLPSPPSPSPSFISSSIRRSPISSQFPMADDPLRSFESSLSHDDAIVSVNAEGSRSPSINDQQFTNLLFGDTGVLTHVFKMLDAQKMNEKTKNVQAAQADPASAKVNSVNDFTKVFDALLKGSNTNQFGEPGPELPEFLGICNRLSCGDIYKAIDQFRKSEFFSNFQTALTLVQDPKGWEILGKLLSNPELIAQFTGGAAGGVAGTEGGNIAEMFGSAIGGARTEVNKEDALTGDFGTDFSALAKGDKTGLPETSFSVDRGVKGAGGGEDYYAEIVHNIDEDFDEDGDELIEEKSEKIPIDIKTAPPLTPLFSPPATTTPLGGLSPSTLFPPTVSSTSPPLIPLPNKEDKVELSFSIDEEYGEGISVDKNIDALPPAPIGKSITPMKTIDEDEKASSTTRVTVKSTSVNSTTTTTVSPTTTSTTTVTPSTTITTRMTSTLSTKNFRKDSDYYAMYYDQ